MTGTQQQLKWAATAIKELRDAGSWTGRIHVQKLFALLDVCGAEVPFEFELYHYGPYSRSLDGAIAELETWGQVVREVPEPGYGPKYRVADEQVLLSDGDPARTLIRETANLLGDRKSRDLELISTCAWVEKREHKTAPGEIVRRVHELKPKYSESDIEPQVSHAQEMCEKISQLLPLRS